MRDTIIHQRWCHDAPTTASNHVDALFSTSNVDLEHRCCLILGRAESTDQDQNDETRMLRAHDLIIIHDYKMTDDDS